MPLITSQNWDGVVAPSIPANWNVSSGTYLATVANTSMQAGSAPTSNPNVFGLLPNATVSTFFTNTWETQDGYGGNVLLQCNFNFYASSNSEVGLYCRSNQVTTSFSGSTFYYAYIHDPSGGSNTVGIKVYSAGSPTLLGSVTGVTFSNNTWYTLTFDANSTELQLSLYRITDGYWLNSSGVWQLGVASAVTVFDSTISGQGYFGISLNQANANSYLYSDDFSAMGFGGSAGYPWPPYVVRVPHLYYPQLAE